MKRMLLTFITAVGLTLSASAGSHFKTIHFTSYWTETQKSGLDAFGSSPTQSMSHRVAGDIEINTEDSTFTIAAEGGTQEVYKLTSVAEETDYKQSSYQEVSLGIKDKNGATYRVDVQRHYDLHFVKVFIFPKGSDTYVVYGCDYLKKLK